ncbi:hypothetical protein ANCCAN_23365 [Ancylostoma caninum]|uniref:non-specific serine/threonine protein kinase n=1 Tax=Ancylostoma caninum TaxID=29170 RepID=A0A368FJ12_ANCCA|nr:hypothetical protein ANCCAN_23365 [Ancylostoma caninum]
MANWVLAILLTEPLLKRWTHSKAKMSTPWLSDADSGDKCCLIASLFHSDVITCDRGTILTCGDGRLVGLGGKEDVTRPTLLDELLRVHVSELVCGSEHCLALTEDGDVFVWGNGQDGRLGTGKAEWINTPTQISTIDGIRVTTCRAGFNASALLTEEGQLLAMGNNQFNKLNLAHRQGFFTRERSDAFNNILLPTMLKPFPARIIDVHLGEFHSGVLLESGQVFFFGRNSNYELGFGHAQSVPSGGLRPVKTLLTKACSKLACGNGYTLVGTTENELYFWGSKNGQRNKTDKHGSEPKCDESLRSSLSRWGAKKKCREADPSVEDVVPLPSLILRLDSGDSEKEIRLSSIALSGACAYVVVDTCEGPSASLARSIRPRSGSVPSIVGADEEVNTWLKNELDQAEVIPLNASQEKLAELQARQTFLRKSEPPPAYVPKVPPIFSDARSKACVIL